MKNQTKSKFYIRLLLGGSSLMAVGLLALFFINSTFMRGTLYDHVMDYMQQTQALYAQEIDMTFLAKRHTVEAMSLALAALPDEQLFHEVMAQFVARYDFIEDAFVGFADGTLINGSGWGRDTGVHHAGLGWIAEGWTLSTRPWFVAALAAADYEWVVTEPYVSASMGNITTAIALWMPDLLGVGGAVGISISLEFVLDNLRDHPILGDGQLILLCECGDVLFHPDARFAPVDGVIPRLQTLPGGDFIARSIHTSATLVSYENFQFGASYIVIAPLTQVQWTLLSIIPKGVTQHPLYEDLYTIMVVLAAFMVLFFIVVALFVSYLMKGMEKWRDQEELLRIEIAHEQAASRAKSSFLSNMSHEIRTPMNAIKSMTLFAKKAPDVYKKDAYIKKIEDASEHLLGIINQILDMSQIEADKFTLVPRAFNFADMMNEVTGFLHVTASTKDIYLTADMADGLPLTIVADDRRLAQVITNLIANAIKFTPQGGRVHLSVQQDENERLRFTITDTGVGIPLDAQAGIFNAFEQAEAGQKVGGTGLGLAICKRIVTMMGGDIWVESEGGQGATFIFTLPITAAGAAALPDGEGLVLTPNCFQGRTFLLAEDIEINREIILTLLEDSGAEMVCAENGAQALAIFRANPARYDLIMMDLQMPEMDGLTATKHIREFDQTTPIIALTANVFQEDIQTCLDAGMNDHLGKPLEVEDMVKKIMRHLPV